MADSDWVYDTVGEALKVMGYGIDIDVRVFHEDRWCPVVYISRTTHELYYELHLYWDWLPGFDSAEKYYTYIVPGELGVKVRVM